MKGPEGEKLDKRKETDPTEVASYNKPWWLRSILWRGFEVKKIEPEKQKLVD